MQRLADDLAVGGVDMYLAHEQEWYRTPFATFMQGVEPAPEPRKLNPVAIYSRWNSKAAPSAPVVAQEAQPRLSITDLDPSAIYAKWNTSAPRPNVATEA